MSIKINDVTRIFMIGFLQAALIIFIFLYLFFFRIRGSQSRRNIHASRADGCDNHNLVYQRDLITGFNYTNKFAFLISTPTARASNNSQLQPLKRLCDGKILERRSSEPRFLCT